MVFLIFSILFMTGLAVFFGAGARAGANPLGLNTVFRFTGGMLAVLTLPWVGDGAAVPQGRLLVEALISGGFYWLSGFAAIKAVSHGHLGVTWTVTRCSVVMPALASIVYWQEIPLWPPSQLLLWRIAGLLLTLVTVALLGVDRQRAAVAANTPRPSRQWVLWLALTFVAQGAWETMLRTSKALPNDDARASFILTVFITAMVLSLLTVLAWRPPLGRREWLYGGLAGVCGFLGSGLRPFALRDLDGIIVFPVTAISVTLLVQAAGAKLWGQKLGPYGHAGLGAAVAAILCLTL